MKLEVSNLLTEMKKQNVINISITAKDEENDNFIPPFNEFVEKIMDRSTSQLYLQNKTLKLMEKN